MKFSRHSGDFYHNDGLDLGAATGQYDFIFSFDSLVHAEIEVFESYVPQILSKLTNDGVAFIHHTNFRACGNPNNIHLRSLTVDANKIFNLIGKCGGSVVVQERVNWVGCVELVDCLTTVSKHRARPAIRLDNARFMTEAQIIKDFHTSYC